MVTGGATPLEGLPGERSCGDLDPSIVLTLARDKGWGPEQINTVLTQQSGLLGLTGKPATLKDVLTSDDPAVDLAREVFRYRVLLASGAGMATMGGLDTIVFSGRDHAVSKNLGPWLASRLTLDRSANKREIPWTVFTKPVDRVIADVARDVDRVEHVPARKVLDGLTEGPQPRGGVKEMIRVAAKDLGINPSTPYVSARRSTS